MKKKKSYPVIYLQSSLKSFSWNDGLFIVINQTDDIYELCKLNDNGQPQLYDDGRFMIACTGIGNKGITITKTKLVFIL